MRRWRWGLGLLGLLLLGVAVVLPSAYKAKERALHSLAQGYFQQIERGDWPAKSGPCPQSSSSEVKSCRLDFTNPQNPAVQFALKNGKTLTLTKADVLKPRGD